MKFLSDESGATAIEYGDSRFKTALGKGGFNEDLKWLVVFNNEDNR